MSTTIGNSIITSSTTGSQLTGPTGATGPTGGTGNTGATGNGINFIRKIDSNGITIFLLDGTEFTITGLSGNSAGSSDFPTNPYGVTGATGTGSLSFNIRGTVSGLTATFKPVKGLGGLSLGYQGSDLIFRGLTTGSGFGVTNAILYSAGNTAAPLVGAGGLNNIFRYETHTSGSTTQHVARATISKFLQGTNSTGITNINLINITGITSNIKNFADASVNSFYTNNGVWENKQWYNTSFKDVRAIVTPAGAVQNSGITSTTNIVFRTQDTTPYALQEHGSCCFCNVDKKCLDYVTRSYCNSVTGTFSAKLSCDTRKNNRDAACYSKIGACCINGTCVETTESQCTDFGGLFELGKTCFNATTCRLNNLLIFYDGGTGDFNWSSKRSDMKGSGRKHVQAWDDLGARLMPFFGSVDSIYLASENPPIPSQASTYKNKLGWTNTGVTSSKREAEGFNTSAFNYITKWEIDGIIEVLKLQGLTTTSEEYVYFNWTEDYRDFPLFPGMTGPSDNIHKYEIGGTEAECALLPGGEWSISPGAKTPTCKIPMPRAIIAESNSMSGAKTEKENYRDSSIMMGKLFSDQVSTGTDGSTFFGVKHYFPNCKFGIYNWPTWNYYFPSGTGYNTLSGSPNQINNSMNIAADAYISMTAMIDATDMLMPSLYCSLNVPSWNRLRSIQAVEFCNIINDKLVAQGKPKKLIIPFVSSIYNTISTGGPYHDKKFTGTNAKFSQDYIPPYTIMTDNDIKYEQIDPLILTGADGATNWIGSHYRAIQTAGRNANGVNEDTTPQSSFRRWPFFSGPNGTPIGSEQLPGYGSNNLWSDKSMLRQAVSAHLNYTNGANMGVTGNRWWYKETPAQQISTPPEWKLAGGLCFNHAIPAGWNGTDFIPGATSTAETYNLVEGVYLDSIERTINVFVNSWNLNLDGKLVL